MSPQKPSLQHLSYELSWQPKRAAKLSASISTAANVNKPIFCVIYCSFYIWIELHRSQQPVKRIYRIIPSYQRSVMAAWAPRVCTPLPWFLVWFFSPWITAASLQHVLV